MCNDCKECLNGYDGSPFYKFCPAYGGLASAT